MTPMNALPPVPALWATRQVVEGETARTGERSGWLEWTSTSRGC